MNLNSIDTEWQTNRILATDLTSAKWIHFRFNSKPYEFLVDSDWCWTQLTDAICCLYPEFSEEGCFQFYSSDLIANPSTSDITGYVFVRYGKLYRESSRPTIMWHYPSAKSWNCVWAHSATGLIDYRYIKTEFLKHETVESLGYLPDEL